MPVVKRFVPYFLLLFGSLVSCQPSPERLLPRADGRWQLSRMVYEYSQGFTLVDALDTVAAGELWFDADGTGWWAHPFRTQKVDSSQQDPFSWQLDPDETGITLAFEQAQPRFGQLASFRFQILSANRNRQVWRVDQSLRVYDELQRDSVDAQIRWQWTLSK